MVNIELSNELGKQLTDQAKKQNIPVDSLLKTILYENQQLKKKPEGYYDSTKVSSKENKNKKGEVTSYSYSTAIPKPILNKLGLKKGQLLYWDIDDYKIVITPDLIPTSTPEEESVEAGYDILQDMLINANTSVYINALSSIKTELKYPNEVKTIENKITSLVEYYNDILSKPEEKIGFTQVVKYLLDYPLDLQNQYEILQEVYDQITQTD